MWPSRELGSRWCLEAVLSVRDEYLLAEHVEDGRMRIADSVREVEECESNDL